MELHFGVTFMRQTLQFGYGQWWSVESQTAHGMWAVITVFQLPNSLSESGNYYSTKGVRVLMESDPGKTVERYVPNVHRAMHELKPPTPISLDDSILRTASWIRKNRVIS
jgi:hypothetical protein